MAAAEQRLTRAADTYNAAEAELVAIVREALGRGMPVPAAARATGDGATRSPGGLPSHALI
ncbi:hypothetical protein [Streptomyces bobili]|uniref:hypothetical protein n=1 Tax=Streptomyces bobili TaxID=67280 RepID=UPI0037B7AD69